MNKPNEPVLYPSRRFHKNGVDSMVVNSPAQEQALMARDPDQWFSVPQPKPYVAPPKPPRSSDELESEMIEMMKAMNCELESKLEIHAKQIEELTKSNSDLNDVVSELMSKVDNLNLSNSSVKPKR